ncbi:hypothetical protein FA15DRAFT_592621 [Coprinopsis marcescibilis]|uniref:DUF6570 domain-containing protein n=1 Tax=Coprinopsis marcescibilis TaxID=230819 RepID=A0A5C3KUJ6_COPMA|nr:hypothetical protein FA15DRAFT_592621 [Coprinopsis marcescibilis]
MQRVSFFKVAEPVKISSNEPFPPEPASHTLIENIIRNYCDETSPAAFEENGCAVCGQLTPIMHLSKISDCDVDLSCLISSNNTRKERKHESEPVIGYETPAIVNKCDPICTECLIEVKKGCSPKYSLANGLWIGDVPDELQDLTFAERILISRVCHNPCLM